MPDDPELDPAAILREAVTGRSVRDIAKARGVRLPEINRVLDLEAERLFGAPGLRRAMLVEAERLSLLKQSLWNRAMKDGDNTAAATYVKASERLASMIGMNHPHGHLVTISGSIEPIEHETSTQNLRRILGELKRDRPTKYPAAGEESPAEPDRYRQDAHAVREGAVAAGYPRPHGGGWGARVACGGRQCAEGGRLILKAIKKGVCLGAIPPASGFNRFSANAAEKSHLVGNSSFVRRVM